VSATMRVMEPLSLTVALRERGREQFASSSTEAPRSGRCAFMSGASGLGAGEERGAKNIQAALASGGGALGVEASLAAAPTFVAEVLVAEFFFLLVVLLLLLFLAASTSRAALSNSLVPPTIAAYDSVGSLDGGWGGPLAEGPGGAGIAEGGGRDVWAGGGAETCVGGRCATLCDRSRRLDSIWFSCLEWSTPSGRELATRDSRSLVWRWSSSIFLPIADMAWTREQRRGRIVLSARETSPISRREGTGSCSPVRPGSCLVFRRK